MYGTVKKPQKRQREDRRPYLLTTSSTWILDEAVPTTSALLVASYNDTIQFEQTFIKEELDTKNVDATSFETNVLPKDAVNKSAVKIDKDAESSLYVKLEEDCEEGNEINDHIDDNALIDLEEKAGSIGTELKDKSEGDGRKGINESLTVSRSLSSVYGHIKTVDGVVCFQCDFCARLFKFRCDIALHRRSHTKERIFKCDKCTKSFTSNSNLRQHINIVHKKHEILAKCTNGRFKCDKCNKTYSTSGSLKGHICKTFKCEQCKKTYSTLETLKCHNCIIPGSKGKRKVKKCEKCKKEFKKEECFLRHINFECYYTALEALKSNKLGVYKACK